MRILLLVLASLLAFHAASHEHPSIDSAQDLESRCKQKLSDYYFTKRTKLMNWRANRHTKDGQWVVEAKAKADFERIEATCSVDIGGALRHVNITLSDGQVLASSSSSLDPEDELISTDKQLQIWCMQASRLYLVKRGLTPRSWTSTNLIQGSQFSTKGAWRSGFERKIFECTARKDSKRKNASIKLQ